MRDPAPAKLLHGPYRPPARPAEAKGLSYFEGTMFQQACRLYSQCLASFGGGKQAVKPSVHACSCLLSHRHVLTAAHPVQGMRLQGFRVVVFRLDGIFECSPLFVDDASDVAILEIEKC